MNSKKLIQYIMNRYLNLIFFEFTINIKEIFSKFINIKDYLKEKQLDYRGCINTIRLYISNIMIIYIKIISYFFLKIFKRQTKSPTQISFQLKICILRHINNKNPFCLKKFFPLVKYYDIFNS